MSVKQRDNNDDRFAHLRSTPPSIDRKEKEKEKEKVSSPELLAFRATITSTQGAASNSSPLRDHKMTAFTPDLKELKGYIETKKIGKALSASNNPTPGQGVDLRSYKIGNSSNPVALLSDEYYVPYQLLEGHLAESDTAALQKESESSESNGSDSFNLTSDSDSESSASSTNFSYESEESSGSSDDEFDILSDTIKDVEPEELTKYFDKSHVINNAVYLLETNPAISNDLHVFLQKLRAYRGDYIDNEMLQMLAGDKISVASLKRNVEPHVRLGDLKPRKALYEAAKEAIQVDFKRAISLQRIDHLKHQATVYKGGRENLREILAMKKAEIEGYDDVLHLKEDVPPINYQLNWGATPLVNPIKSEFLVGYEHIDSNDWSNWGKARKQYDFELFKYGKVSEETLSQFKQAEQVILSYGVDATQLCKLAFYETKVNASDFHINQFMIGVDPKKEGYHHAISIDEGRWGPPNDVYVVTGTPSDSVAVNFRNALITHPLCLKPVPQEFREFLEKRVGEIDHTAQEMKKNDLVYPEGEFEELGEEYEKLLQLDQSLFRYKIQGEQLVELAKQYDVPLGEKINEADLTLRLRNHLKERREVLKEKAFVKQSEQSLLLEIKREKVMAEYILNNKEATIYDAFEAGYPRMATFMKVFRRMDADPGFTLAYNTDFGFPVPRNLTTFIENIEKQGMASAEEILQMQQDVIEMQHSQVAKNGQLALTHEGG
jgi:hypothetical protein